MISKYFNSEIWWTYIIPLLTILYIIIVVRVFFTILLENRNPLKTQSYLLVLVLLPVVGLVIYFFFGVNYRREKLFSRKNINDNYLIKKWREEYEVIFKEHEKGLEQIYGEKIKVPFLNFANERSALTAYNKIDILINGEEKFPRLITDLKNAKHHIHLEYYIFIDNEIGKEIINILCRKVSEGVIVRVILDAVGSMSISKEAIRKLKSSGVLIHDYLSVRIPRFASKINYRDHRKIVVIDGLIGYVGGINIDDKYINKPGADSFWRDTHLRIEGDAVQSLQLLFVLNWYFASDSLIEPSNIYFPANSIQEMNLVSILGSDPDSDSKSMMEMYFSMITNARKSIRITTPYFIPNESIMTALKTASKSGVSVELMLPGESDTRIAQNATYSFIGELIRAGVKVWIYQNGMVHAKSIVVDDNLSTVGTANLDYRSFEQNAEVNAVILSEDIAEKMNQQYLIDIENCKAYTLEDWKNRSFIEKLMGSFARLFAPLL